MRSGSTSSLMPAGTREKDDPDMKCRVCRQLLGSDVYMTKCGHNFCHDCVSAALSVKQECPQCGSSNELDEIYPNSILSKLNFRARGAPIDNPVKVARALIVHNPDLSLNELEVLSAEINARKEQMMRTEWDTRQQITEDFLSDRIAAKTDELRSVVEEISMLKEDERRLHAERLSKPAPSAIAVPEENVPSSASESLQKSLALGKEELDADVLASINALDTDRGSKRKDPADIGPKPAKRAARTSSSGPMLTLAARPATPSLSLPAPRQTSPDRNESSVLVPEHRDREDVVAKRRNIMQRHIGDLERCYFVVRKKCRTQMEAVDGLRQFRMTLMGATRYNRFQERAKLSFADISNNSAIVSSIEFDKDQEYFATAGVTKKIKIFSFNNIIEQPRVDSHPSEREMVSLSKISCLSWNPYTKYHIASSDYDGVVCMWDVNTGQTLQRFTEHEKRAWSVDFSPVDPTLLASGSDDTKVKIWSVKQQRGKSVHTIESKANICCVRFNPEQRDYIAFGSADHHIHYYDLRQLSQPVYQFKGHDKAVSYVKFLNGREMVSASTDSTLKLWEVNSHSNTQTFTGHKNEKNFVGLTTNGEFIACGSENNSVFCYHKDLSKSLISYNFGTMTASTGQEKEDDDSPTHFVSSVCWKPKSNILLAANSQGTIKVLEAV